MSLIEVDGLTVGFGRQAEPVVRGVSFHVEPGECLAVVGESGSGKSVTVRALLGLAGPRAVVSAKRLRLDGQDATAFSRRQWQAVRGRVVGMVLQDAMVSLDPMRRVGSEIGEPLKLHTGHRRQARAERVAELLREVGVPDPRARRGQYPHQLSGGLRQRALIASALAAGPKALIADEPTTALDVIVQEQILRLLGRIKDSGVGLLMISHDLAVVARLADRVAVMHDGAIVETGATARVLDSPAHPYTRLLIDAVPDRRTRRRPGRRARGAPVLQIDAISKTYPKSPGMAVDAVSLSLREGETLGLVGESGSGKSTVARIATGLLTPDDGQVLFDGAPWSALAERERRPRRGLIQIIHQNPQAAFDPRFTVRRIIGEAMPGVARGRREERTIELLGTVDLDPRIADRRPHELSGGQRQRVAIARALAARPKVLVCDEPVSALDVSVQAQVLDLLERLQRDTGAALLLITHDLGVVERTSDRLAVMKDGRVVEEGATEAVFDHPEHPYTRALLAAVPSLDVSARSAAGEESRPLSR
ncbi:dipeptide ABC transporter ATP-binding protein [Protofrankia coriariae]|uniref:ABC transporter ATP-binding protein n=1 Tax=Protofrankia coriariae TaxID=1562887 RepID=A0ABR5F4Q9_9ACTN|nr:ABC transporter ATP-binding protein [Protofrankia coriariae]KLL11670.1 ABC transporter ATP-binding protein [Protofrankia coriariae]